MFKTMLAGALLCTTAAFAQQSGPSANTRRDGRAQDHHERHRDEDDRCRGVGSAGARNDRRRPFSGGPGGASSPSSPPPEDGAGRAALINPPSP